MRPVISGDEGGSRMEKQSLAGVRELWNEIHCLMLLSLSLQLFLFLAAGMRRRSASRILSTTLWLSYLSADYVAVFALGHLAVRASEPGHQLMSFWAPFLLVHLGGQDTITAFSKQDNELWRRQLLSLVSQVSVAGYVVAKASWPDGRLLAAMVIMFLSGCFKYAERTLCLYLASPVKLRAEAMDSLPEALRDMKQAVAHRADPAKLKSAGKSAGINSLPEALRVMMKPDEAPSAEYGGDGYDVAMKAARRDMRETLDMMSKGSISGQDSFTDIFLVDAPLNKVQNVLVADDLPGMLIKKLLPIANRCGVYEYVGAGLSDCYRHFYTKYPLRECFYGRYLRLLDVIEEQTLGMTYLATCSFTFLLLGTLFLYVSTSVALVLFWAVEKGGQLHTNSRADVIVSYMLLVGAVVLDVSSVTMSIFSIVKRFNLSTGILSAANYIHPAWSRKHWSEELAQYSMIRRHTVQDNAGIVASVWRWISRRLGTWGVELLEVTHMPITKDDTPIKEFVLDNLLGFGIRKEWNIASSRGQLTLHKWMDIHQDPDSARIGRALKNIITSSVDFSTSVLIWHIATDICYCHRGDTLTNSKHVKQHKQMSRKLSNYIMYLVFKCGVVLTSNSQLVHDKAHDEISNILNRRQVYYLDEVDAVTDLYKNQRCRQETAENLEDSMDLVDRDDDAGSHLWKIMQSTQEAYSPVLPRACKVAHELININDETDRWLLIASVWSEMLYYTAPRCGGDFHYEHLSTGGEFITHVLVLMYSLGPFLSNPDPWGVQGR